MTIQTPFGRRKFLVSGTAVTGGLSLGFSFPFASAQAAEAQEVNAWVVIHPDDKVVIRIARSEMGQGTLTGLAQLVAEELECDWSKVTTEYPTPGENLARKRVWGNFSTGGSRGIRESQDYVRRGGAAARMMLIEAAAREWQVPAAECSAANGIVTHRPSGRKLSRDKLTGKQIYGIDLKLPGMLTASVRACPVFGGTVRSFEPSRVEHMPGVKKVVAVGANAVAVIADNFWNAKTALAALPVVWDEGPNAALTSAAIAETVKAGLDADEAFVGNKAGDVKAALGGAAKTVEAVYAYPFQSHATMEPMNATARYTPEKCEVWCPTQNGEAALAAAAEASGLPVSKCEVYKLSLGGGFGRRGRSDYVQQAVAVAKQMPGVPIKLIWTREEDMTHDFYHPLTQCKLTGGLDKDGNLVALHMRLSGHSILASLAPQNLKNGMDPAAFQGLNPGGKESAFGYNVPNLLIDHAMRNSAIPVGFWRGVNTNHNAIYVECFIDECAHAAGQDPLEYRRKLLKPEQFAVLKAAADKAGYGKPPPGRHHGIAQIMGYGSYVAACAEVSVGQDGRLKIHKIVGATNPGHVVNPAQVERQVAGSFVYGLSAMLYGECTIAGGAVEQTNFDGYNVMRIDEMPQVETVIMPSGGFWGGVGEPTIAVAAPAVLNAIFAATGKRIRTFPLMHHDLRAT